MIATAARVGILLSALGGLITAPSIFAQTQEDAANPCSDPAVILSRYIDALGGRQAIDLLETRIAEARETEPYSFKPQDTATYHYRFKWKSPDKTVVKYTHVVSMGGLPVPFAKAHFIFDGEQWSDFRGKAGVQRRGQRRREFPGTAEAMRRVTADPLMFARAGDLYSSFAPANDFRSSPDRCIVEARGNDGRLDYLYFDRDAGFLRQWQVDMSTPGRKQYQSISFFFDDYRQAGEVVFPFYIYSDFYKATFRYQKVLHNQPLPDSDFEIKP